MARNRRLPRNRRGLTKRLDTALAGAPSVPEVPVWWVNTVIGVFLLPVAGILTQTFFSSFAAETLGHGFWRSEEFWFFGLGAVLMVLAFFGLPKPVLVYVFGHELTHAVWVWMMGGRVSGFRVGSEGGHVLTDKHNVWIALAPYFYPIYSMILLAVYGAASLFVDVAPYQQWFLGLLGVTWAFHACFTVWMIPKGQTDLSYHGTFFSMVVIYVANLVLLSCMLVLASPRVTAGSFAGELGANAAGFARWVWAVGERCWGGA